MYMLMLLKLIWTLKFLKQVVMMYKCGGSTSVVVSVGCVATVIDVWSLKQKITQSTHPRKAGLDKDCY